MEITTTTIKSSVKAVKRKRNYYRTKYIRTKKMLKMALTALDAISQEKGWLFAPPASKKAKAAIAGINKYTQLPLKNP